MAVKKTSIPKVTVAGALLHVGIEILSRSLPLVKSKLQIACIPLCYVLRAIVGDI